MCFSYPNEIGMAISKLNVGDEVIFQEVVLQSEEDGDTITDIVVGVDGYSALTAGGHVLTCHLKKLETTGKHLEPGQYQISPEAQAILDEIASAQARWDASWQE